MHSRVRACMYVCMFACVYISAHCVVVQTYVPIIFLYCIISSWLITTVPIKHYITLVNGNITLHASTFSSSILYRKTSAYLIANYN